MNKCPVCHNPYGLIDLIMNPSMCLSCFKKHSDSIDLARSEELEARVNMDKINRSEIKAEVEIKAEAEKTNDIILNSNVKSVFLLIIRLFGFWVASVSFLHIIMSIYATINTSSSFVNAYSVWFDFKIHPLGALVFGIIIVLFSRWLIELLAWDMKWPNKKR